MNKREKIRGRFGSGYNCAEAIISEYCEELSLDYNTALKIFRGLGGGMNSGEICGALAAGILIISMIESENKENRSKILKESFLKKYGCIKCRELLEADPTTVEGHAKIQREGGFQKICPEIVEDVVQLIERLKGM